jgi:hypothetical protein
MKMMRLEGNKSTIVYIDPAKITYIEESADTGYCHINFGGGEFATVKGTVEELANEIASFVEEFY